MLVTIEFSNNFFNSIVNKNLTNNEKFYDFLKRILDEEDFFILGDKLFLKKILKNLKNIQNNKIFEIIYRYYNRPNLIDINKAPEIPRDFILLSDEEKIEKNNTYNIEQIKKNSINILKNFNKIKSEIFDLELKYSPNSLKYKVNQNEIDKFNNKLLKSMFISKTVIIYDQYIPSSLAFIKEKKGSIEFKEGKYFKDYCNTLKYLDNKIFSKNISNKFCEIITMNKLQESSYFENFSNKFENLAKVYLNNLKSLPGKIYIKDYDPDAWVDLHSRLLIFKDEFDQLIAYFIVEPGLDFIKLENVNFYKKKGKKGQYSLTKKFRYRFTPGTKDNFYDKISLDLMSIKEKSGGLELINTPLRWKKLNKNTCLFKKCAYLINRNKF